MEISGSEALIKSLLAEKVDVVFGYPGGAIMPVYDALYDYQDKLKHVLVRHEQGAVHAAEGYAAASGKVGVCIATSGPGAMNCVTGLADAMLDSIPIICITGQVASGLLGTDAFQEVDVIGVTTPITKWNYQITDVKEIPEIVAKAFYIARTGRPGPVVIDITKDAQLAKAEFSYPDKVEIKTYNPQQKVDVALVEAAAQEINKAQRPMILAGHGVVISDASNELIKLAEKANIPIACTLLGLSSCPTDHPMYVGMLGMHGHYGPNKLTNKADLLIAIGMRFDDRVTSKLSVYAKQARVIHIDIDESEVNKNVKTNVSIVADAKDVLQALNPLVNKAMHKDWMDNFVEHSKVEYDKVIKHEVAHGGNEITMAEVVSELSDQVKGEAILVADVGQNQMKSARYFNFTKPRTFITSGGAGTMGFALPAVIGAKFARPNINSIAIIGDGAFQMTIQELGTISQEKLPVKIIIMHNGYLGMVRQWQELFFSKRYSFTPLHNPDFLKIAEGYGIQGKRVAKREDVKSALKEMVSAKGPYILEFMVKPEENVFPMVPTNSSLDDIRLE